MTTRLEKFRGYMARLNSNGDPRDSVGDGLCVPLPGRATAEEVAAELVLDPTSSHLIVGGSGSGKTTQLHVVCDRLNAREDTHAEYIDVSLVHDMSQMVPGTLIIAAGLALGRLLRKLDDKALPAATGQDDRYYDISEENITLLSLEKLLDSSLEHKVNLLSQVRDGLRVRFSRLILLFDSLDRLSDQSVFGTIVEEDVRAIQKVGIGLVLVGPLRSKFAPYRVVTDHFQHFYTQHTVDARQDDAVLAFLVNVLRKRVPSELFSDSVCQRLAAFSGGSFRDLFALARSAGEEAYVRGADRVELEHVNAAADGFGRTLAFGLKPAEIEALQRLRKTGIFIPTTDDDLALLVTRRVLEYRNGSSRFSVHPALEPVLGAKENGDRPPHLWVPTPVL